MFFSYRFIRSLEREGKAGRAFKRQKGLRSWTGFNVWEGFFLTLMWKDALWVKPISYTLSSPLPLSLSLSLSICTNQQADNLPHAVFLGLHFVQLFSYTYRTTCTAVALVVLMNMIVGSSSSNPLISVWPAWLQPSLEQITVEPRLHQVAPPLLSQSASE